MDESLLINKVRSHKKEVINNPANVNDFIDTTKRCQIDNLRNCLPDDTIGK